MTTGMRVCLVTPYSPKEVSGVGQVVLSLGKGLSKRNHSYEILTKSVEGEEEIPGMVEIPYREMRLIGGFLLIVAMLMEILRKRKDIDILHLHSISSLTMFSAILGRVLGIPTVLTLHGKFPESQVGVGFKLKQRLAIAMSSCVTCVSQDTKDFHKLTSAIVVRNGIDTTRFVPDPGARERTRNALGLGGSFAILFVGRWVIHKGIYHTIQLTRDLVKKGMDVKLVLVGSGDDHDVRNVVSTLSIDENVVLVGRVDDVVPYYQSSDLFVLFTSPLEGLPLTLLEAMACGLPCIATSVSGIAEVIEDGVNGFSVEEADEKGFEKLVTEIIEGSTDLDVIGERARTTVVNRLSLDVIGERARTTVVNRLSLDKMTEEYIRVFGSLLRS
jgi:glycosyltransferase involved in cell wall biosynthesis